MSTQAEMAVIGSLLTDGKQWNNVKTVLLPEMMYDGLDRAIYSTIGKELEAGRAVDEVVVAQMCASDIYPVEVVVQRIAECLQTSVTSVNAGRYAREARKQWAVWKYNSLPNDLSPATVKTIADRANELKTIADSLMDIPEVSDKGRSLAETVDEFQSEYFCDKAAPYVQTGLELLDDSTQLEPGDVTILAARPSVGKSALVTQIAKNMSDQGKKVGYFSLEMNRKQCYERFVVASSGIGLTRLKRAVAFTNDEEARFRKANDELRKAKNLILYQESFTVDGIRAEVEAHKFDIIIVDYLQLVSSSDRYKGNRVQEVTEISRGLKGIATDCGIHVLALSQFNRAAANEDNGEPSSDKLRESGALEQDASNVWLLWNPDKDDNKKKYLKLDKNRQGERFIKIELNFNGDTMHFEEVGYVEGKNKKPAPKKADRREIKNTDDGPFINADIEAESPFQMEMDKNFLWR